MIISMVCFVPCEGFLCGEVIKRSSIKLVSRTRQHNGSRLVYCSFYSYNSCILRAAVFIESAIAGRIQEPAL